MQDLNESIFELRYKPNPKIIDFRGIWAMQIAEHMGLPSWRITDNRIDIYDENTKDHGFVGFRNTGYSAVDSTSKPYFSDKTIKLMKFIFSLDGFGKRLFIERIGLRYKVCRPFEQGFEKLVELFSTNYFCMTEKAKKIIDAKILDVGAPINFADKIGNFNTMCGPMAKAQIVRFLEKSENHPEIGLYFEVDYWLTPKKEFGENEIIGHVRNFSSAASERYEQIVRLILGE
jgi:hypothetical protein